MARVSDGRMGVSVNAETVDILDVVRTAMKEQLGINASYTQAIQYLANHYMKDNVTPSHNVVDEQGE